MRLISAIWADMRFQMKQGFFFVYIGITLMYLIILSFLPSNIVDITLPLVVFSDPSVLGMFFIGGIIMLEKSQGVLSVLIVSPLRTGEYIIAKTISLTIIGVLVACAITGFSSYQGVNWFLLIIATALTSGIFTMLGIIINAGCNTVNEYMLETVPYMLLFIAPCFSLIGFPYSDLFTVVPSVSALRLMLGAYMGIVWYEAIALIVYLLAANYLFFRWTVRVFERDVVFKG